MPLHLFEKFLTSTTVPSGVYLRRTSPGMSEKSRWCSFGCQIGPSVNVKPVATPLDLRALLDELVDRLRLGLEAEAGFRARHRAPFVAEWSWRL